MKRILLALAFVAIAMVSRAQTPYYPTIQDTFFGMKMGSKQTAQSIKMSVGNKGEFLNEAFSPLGKVLRFKEVLFAGRTWDFGYFYLTENGALYVLCVECILPDYMLDDQKEAQVVYDSYKQKLTDKYGKQEEKGSDEEKSILWLGDNNMSVAISNDREKSYSGEYRRSVSIFYVQKEIYDKQSQKSDDEL